MIFRFRCEKRGIHWHCDVFSGPALNETFARIGKLIMDERDFASITKLGSELPLQKVDDRVLYAFQFSPDGVLDGLETCEGCGEMVDPSVCHCGIEHDRHVGEEHSFVPMGCDCYRSRP